MPQKYDEVVFCPMTARQIDVYKKIQKAFGEKTKKGDTLKFCAAFLKVRMNPSVSFEIIYICSYLTIWL
jgi:hypothetical protein